MAQINKEVVTNEEVISEEVLVGDVQSDEAETAERNNLKTGSLFFKPNARSYQGVLLASLCEIVFLILILTEVNKDYRIGIFILVNIIFLLMLFTCALQVKVYNKFWTYVGLVFGGYCLLRTFIIPLSLEPKSGTVMFAIINVITAVFMIASGVFSMILIKKREKFKKDGKINFIQMSK